VFEQVSVPIWLIVIVSTGWVALVAAAFLFGRADWRAVLDLARDSETAARFAAIKENASRRIHQAVAVHAAERAALAGVPFEYTAAARPRPRVPIRAVIERVDYVNAATSTAPWVAVDVKPDGLILDEPEPEPVPDGERPVEDDGDGYPPCLQAEAASALRRQAREVGGDKRDNAAPGRHRLPKSRSDDTRQFTFRETLDAAIGEPS
jgi:hypothetical protein